MQADQLNVLADSEPRRIPSAQQRADFLEAWFIARRANTTKISATCAAVHQSLLPLRIYLRFWILTALVCIAPRSDPALGSDMPHPQKNSPLVILGASFLLCFLVCEYKKWREARRPPSIRRARRCSRSGARELLDNETISISPRPGPRATRTSR